jgi:OmpA-OmpF porin, OOP family
MKNLFAVFFFVFLFAPVLSWAQEDASAQTFHPSIDSSKYFSIYGSQTLQPWQFRIGTYFNYANDPLEFGTPSLGRRAGIIDHLVMGDVFGSLGVLDWLQVGVNIPVAVYEKFFDPNDPAQPTPPGKTLVRMGDVRFETKVRIFNDFVWPIGLSIRPFVTFPTGDGDTLVGNDSFTGGADVVFDFDIRDRVFVAVNLGYMTRESISPFGLNVEQDDMLRYGMGVHAKFTPKVSAIVEGYGTTLVGELYATETEIPVEVLGGMRFYPTEGWQLSVGGGVGLTDGYGSPDYRALAEVSYTRPRIIDLPPAPPPPPPVVRVEEKRIVITEKIHFEFDKARIRPVSLPILDAVIAVLQQHSEIDLVQIDGHTDAVGSKGYNQRLSLRRSKSVIKYLIGKGIDTKRLVPKGFGESKPIATNNTAEGRAQNRRTEFNILKRAGADVK